MNDYERWDFWNRETENIEKSKIAQTYKEHLA
jgi:hypothetical protein